MGDLGGNFSITDVLSEKMDVIDTNVKILKDTLNINVKNLPYQVNSMVLSQITGMSNNSMMVSIALFLIVAFLVLIRTREKRKPETGIVVLRKAGK